MRRLVLRWLVPALLAGGVSVLPTCSIVEGMEGAGRGWRAVARLSLGPGLACVFRSLPAGEGQGMPEGAGGQPALRLALGIRLPRWSSGWGAFGAGTARVACLDWDLRTGQVDGRDRKGHR